MKRTWIAGAALAACLAWSAGTAAAGDRPAQQKTTTSKETKVKRSDKEWQEVLTPEQYRVMRCSATEPPFTGKYYKHKADGTYVCAGCGAPLFSSETKYESGSGWPSYWKPVSKDAVREKKDMSHGMVRMEILCARCDAHLGHVFEDGPRPTGLRYCVNSASLDFRPAHADSDDGNAELAGKD